MLDGIGRIRQFEQGRHWMIWKGQNRFALRQFIHVTHRVRWAKHQSHAELAGCVKTVVKAWNQRRRAIPPGFTRVVIPHVDHDDPYLCGINIFRPPVRRTVSIPSLQIQFDKPGVGGRRGARRAYTLGQNSCAQRHTEQLSPIEHVVLCFHKL